MTGSEPSTATRKVFYINTGDVPVTDEQIRNLVEKFQSATRDQELSTTSIPEQLARLAGMPDSEIDFSDIPESKPGTWDNAIRPGTVVDVQRKPR